MHSSSSPTAPAHVTALTRAIAIAGNQAKLAARISMCMTRRVRQQNVSYWLCHKTLISAEYWSAIEQATNGEISRQQLRPDIFGPGG
jgi:DNA-binding transcriptional regulator YdaS (Cro superfamily)